MFRSFDSREPTIEDDYRDLSEEYGKIKKLLIIACSFVEDGHPISDHKELSLWYEAEKLKSLIKDSKVKLKEAQDELDKI